MIQRDNKEKKKKYLLSSATDPLLAELRDLNFAQIGRKLSKVARRLDEDYKVRVGSFRCLSNEFGMCILFLFILESLESEDRCSIERVRWKTGRLADGTSGPESP